VSIPTGLIVAADIQAEYDTLLISINNQSLRGQKDFAIPLMVPALTTSTALSARIVDFTAPDDLELRTLRCSVTSGMAGIIVTAALTVTDGDTTYLLDNTVSVSVTSIVGTAHGNVDVRSTTNPIRVRLLRGVRYRLSISSPSATATNVSAALVLRTRRRRR
jgi:hypothetical protein